MQHFGPNAHFHQCDVSGKPFASTGLWTFTFIFPTLPFHTLFTRIRTMPLASKPSQLTLRPCSDPKSCFAAVDACIGKFKRIDVLFHNAAMLSPIVPVADHDVDVFNKVIMTNLCGAFYLAKAIIPHMKRQGKGVIVNTASVSGIGGDYGLSSYNAAKSGLINLTRTIAMDHARDGIRAVTVCPGFMDTPMSEATLKNEKLREELFESIPMNRGGHPNEVAQLVLFLASDEASYITGHRECSHAKRKNGKEI